MGEYAVILVHTTSHAIQAEKVLMRAGLEVKLIPTPRHLSSDCGSALRIPLDRREACEEALRRAGVPLARVERLERQE